MDALNLCLFVYSGTASRLKDELDHLRLLHSFLRSVLFIGKAFTFTELILRREDFKVSITELFLVMLILFAGLSSAGEDSISSKPSSCTLSCGAECPTY